ncbi:Phosphate metabolism protein [Lachnellula occidentalis]|uniref:Phosphate metabolism protein n=1 Tax=Lachnellula occidentalis TaxID=215460 RepID=A0A8H8RJK6_9HELO|nr:Phosphate metabolism protein [Lachnellula occidentalis]
MSLTDVLYDLRRDLAPVNQSSDPRVGSARDNATGTSVARVPTEGTNSSSFATLFTTFVPLAIYAVICIVIFFVLRRKVPRAYLPRTFLSSLDVHERTPTLPSGWFNWCKPFYQTPDTVVLNHSSLDGFLFLRYLKILCVICGVGCLITWPILLPYHVHGGGVNIQLDALTFGNVIHPSWFYLHACLAWIFFGFILYMVTRECVYFISLRQAYLLSPLYSTRLSSRTVLFTSVPQQILDERKLRRVFGDTVKNIWIPRETDDLDELVKEREQTADRLEKAEILLIQKANAAYRKAVAHGHPDIETELGSPAPSSSKEVDTHINPVSPTGSFSPIIPTSPLSPGTPQEYPRIDGTPIVKTSYGFSGPSPDINGSVASQWIPHSQRPIHRPIANYGRRVDTIKWTRNRLKELAPKIAKLRAQYRKGKAVPIPAVFIEFHTQVDAQSAYQTLAHHRANHMIPETVGVRPQEIIWASLKFRWWERIIRRFLIQGFIAAMVVFWSIPAALVGMISSIKFLTDKLTFLSWINKLPTIVLGLISGLLPAIALAMLMSAVPIMLRACARQAGVPTEAKVELFVQNAYFLFQIVQVFLITTLTSAASSAITDIIKDPMSARSLLSQNLPKASNFYISYFILQGLAMSATRVAHLGSVVRHYIMGNSGNNPKLISARYHRLRRIHWGSIYPVFTNMGVIAISYSLIAPIILGVATIGLFLVYITYRWNLLYVYSSERDTRGLHYPRALKQTLAGVYLAEICMIGLFGVKGAYGPLIMMFGLIIFTTLIHISLNEALGPLLYNLPRTVAAEEALRKSGNSIFNAANLDDMHDAIDVQDSELQHTGYDSDFDPSNPTDTVNHGNQASRGAGVEGVDAAMKLGTTTATSFAWKKFETSPIPGLIAMFDFWTPWISPDPNTKPNFLLKFLHPEIFADYHILRQQISDDAVPGFAYEDSVLRDAYSPPSMRKRSPRIWLPRDVAGISRQEVAHSAKVVEVTDEGAWLNEKGGVNVDLEGETSRWVLRDYERVKF